MDLQIRTGGPENSMGLGTEWGPQEGPACTEVAPAAEVLEAPFLLALDILKKHPKVFLRKEKKKNPLLLLVHNLCSALLVSGLVTLLSFSALPFPFLFFLFFTKLAFTRSPRMPCCSVSVEILAAKEKEAQNCFLRERAAGSGRPVCLGVLQLRLGTR